MKKSILVLAIFSFVAGTMIISCASPAQKVENAETSVTEAKEDLAQAKQEYQEDIENYRQQMAEKITANSQNIADFNVKIEKEKAEAKVDYKMKVAELEQKNRDLKKKLEDYKGEGEDRWYTFKTEFNRDMEKLGVALENLVGKDKTDN